MRDDDPVDFRSSKMLSDAPAQRPHSLHSHVRTGMRAPIIDLEIGELVDAGRHRENVAASEAWHGAARGRVVSHRDRPAREEEDDHPQSTLPPFTFTISPVMCRARSEQRNTIGPAMS